MSRKKLVVRSITVNLRGAETEVIKKIEEKGLEISEVVRSLLREYGEKHFKEDPAYAQALLMRAEVAKEKHKKELQIKTMTDTEYAERVLRAVVLDGGAYVTVPGGRTTGISLHEVKKYKPETSSMIKDHFKILDKEPLVDLFGDLVPETIKEMARVEYYNLKKKAAGEFVPELKGSTTDPYEDMPEA